MPTKALKVPVEGRKIGARIKALRAQHKLSLEALAKQAGVTDKHLRRYEEGSVSPGQIDTIISVAHVLGTSVDYLLTGRAQDVSDARMAKRLWKLDQLSDERLDAIASIVDGLHGGTGAPASSGRPAKGRAAGPSTRASSGAVSAERVLREVKREPGRRMEQLSAALGIESKAISPVMKALIADRKVKTSGQARGTTYRATA